jgi:hypothetical protein
VAFPTVDGSVPPADGSVTPPADGGPANDAPLPPPFDGPQPDGFVAGCSPTNSGTIVRTEVPLMAGLRATFRVATNATVSTAGTTQPDGSRVWDLSGALSGDQDILVETLSPQGAWWASSFANATYATPLSVSSNLLGVFQATDSALLLQGVVSPTNGAPQTNVSYSPAATTLSFPLTMGATFQSTSTVSGMADGIFTTYTEQYASKVDAHGTMKTPYGTFPVLRVHTVLTRTVGLVVTIVRSDAFVAECFGPVATIASQNNEANDEFTNAAEVRRLAP